jgi:hypothetical protein
MVLDLITVSLEILSLDSELQHVAFFAAVLVVTMNSYHQQSLKDIAVHLMSASIDLFSRLMIRAVGMIPKSYHLLQLKIVMQRKWRKLWW